MSLHKSGMPTRCIPSASIGEKWTGFMEWDRRECVCLNIANGVGSKAPWRIWIARCSCVFVICIYTFDVAFNSCCREFGGLGCFHERQALPGRPYLQARWAVIIPTSMGMHSDLTGSEYGGIKQLCVLRAGGIYRPMTCASWVPWTSH